MIVAMMDVSVTCCPFRVDGRVADGREEEEEEEEEDSVEADFTSFWRPLDVSAGRTM